MSRLWLALLPELRQFAQSQQGQALQSARASELEPLELVGLAVWLVPVVVLAKYLLVQASLVSDIPATLVMNILFVVPLLAVVFAPIHIRRLRRGLRKQLEQQGRL
jgi:hypothetical protein